MTAMKSEVVSRFFSLPSGKLHAWVGGKGPALLLLHGGWSGAEMHFGPAWNRLAREFRVIAPDLPGYGASPSLKELSVDATARLLSELLTELSVDRAVVAGNSFGAALAHSFAAYHPERTERLILICGTGFPRFPSAMRKLFGFGPVERLMVALYGRYAFSPAMLRRSFVDPAKHLPPARLAEISENASDRVRMAFRLMLGDVDPPPLPDVPVLAIAGEKDPLQSLKSLREYCEASIPGARVASIPDAGHLPQAERPEEFARMVSEFAR